MISALILPLFLAGTPAGIGGVLSGDPPILLWINNDGRFLRGDHAEVQVRTRDDGYLLVLQADPDGQLRVLFPLDPGDDNFVRGGERYEMKGRGGREAFDIDSSWGRGMLYAAVSRERFRFDGYRLGDHWDYRALAPFQLPREPEPELTDLVSRMAPGDFDYDVFTYEVIERVVYASDYSTVTSNFFISARFFFDSFFQRGFFFDPFFDPFLFDPFLHPGLFFDPFLRRPFFQHPVFADRFFHRPFFRPRGLAPVRFRDRRRDFHPAGNMAPRTPGRMRGAAIASRGRAMEFRGEGPVRLAVPDARQQAVQARRDNWPVDVSPRRRSPVTEPRLANWPVDVSPRRRLSVAEPRLATWPVDVSPRRRDPGLPTGQRALGDRPTELRPQIDGTSRAPGLWSPPQAQGYAPGPPPALHGPVGFPHR